MVDRTNLGRQAFNEFTQFTTPDDGRKFRELYGIQHMQSNVIDPAAKVVITTVQRLYSMLSGEPDLPPELEQVPLEQVEAILGNQPRIVTYNPQVPIETFDFIVIDECHRSIYSVWRQVLEYFDATLIGPTATPAKQTFAFFDQNLVMEYTEAQAVIDRVNVDGWIYTIRTRITEQGSTVEAGEWVGRRDRHTRQERWEQLDEDLIYDAAQLDRSVQAEDQIRTVIRTFRDRLPTEIFPGRREVPKTLIFAKDDHHAEKIVRVVREVFAEGDRFCQKITYKAARDPEEIIGDFRNSYYPRIAVTVDMIATGTDVRPLEVLLFMRTVKSANYFRQMRGRGTRVVSDTDLVGVTPSAAHKDHFVLVDAVGVVDLPMVDIAPVDRKRSLPFDKLLERLVWGAFDADDFESLAVRLARLEPDLTPSERDRVRELAGGSCRELAHALLSAVDPDAAIDRAQETVGPDREPTEDEVARAQASLMTEAAAPFDDPRPREVLTTAQHRSEVTLDTVSQDDVTEIGYRDDEAEARARHLVDSFRAYLDEHQDEITALQLLYERPYVGRALTLQAIRELGDLIEQPPHAWTTQSLWEAYARLERDRVRGVRSQRVLTDIVSLVRHAVQLDDELVPYPEQVRQRYETWLIDQAQTGRSFSAQQRWWLDRIAEMIGLNLSAAPLRRAIAAGVGGDERGIGGMTCSGAPPVDVACGRRAVRAQHAAPLHADPAPPSDFDEGKGEHMPFDHTRHHRRSIRLRGYDYASAGMYFVTICVQNRLCRLGRITDGGAVLSETGEIADRCWRAIPEHFPNVTLDAYVVMPNHVHGIIVIDQTAEPIGGDGSPSGVGVQHAAPLRSTTADAAAPHRVTSGSLGTIVRAFKAAVTREVNATRDAPGSPLWQRNYWEHIIRNADEYERIHTYITPNPALWAEDSFYEPEDTHT